MLFRRDAAARYSHEAPLRGTHTLPPWKHPREDPGQRPRGPSRRSAGSLDRPPARHAVQYKKGPRTLSSRMQRLVAQALGLCAPARGPGGACVAWPDH